MENTRCHLHEIVTCGGRASEIRADAAAEVFVPFQSLTIVICGSLSGLVNLKLSLDVDKILPLA